MRVEDLSRPAHGTMATMPTAAGVRITWRDLPEHVRAGVGTWTAGAASGRIRLRVSTRGPVTISTCSSSSAWLDPLLLLVNVHLLSGHDVDALLSGWVDVDPDVATAVLAGLAGCFTDAARRPAPLGLPTVRQFQADQGTTTLAWVRRRLR